ncbi:MAG: tyrosine-type recombinase/integrase [Pseudomonadota bacterium]
MADRTLAHLRKALTWYAARDDEFNTPIVRGMARTKPKERARKRTLSGEELQDVWRALDALTGPYPALVRLLTLTALRRTDVGGFRRRELEREDLWTIPAERFKGNIDHAVALTAAAKAIIAAQPVRLTTRGKPDRQLDHVFSRSGRSPFGGWSKCKAELDGKIAEQRKAEGREPMPPWVLHDLRRTARSLMSQAGVLSDIAERVLGHVLPGVPRSLRSL